MIDVQFDFEFEKATAQRFLKAFEDGSPFKRTPGSTKWGIDETITLIGVLSHALNSSFRGLLEPEQSTKVSE